MGCRQVVRHWFLVPAFGGSNPSIPARFIKVQTWTTIQYVLLLQGICYNNHMTQNNLYECPICHLHYEDEKIAKQCATYCQENNGCSLEITKLSIERINAQKASHQIETKTE